MVRQRVIRSMMPVNTKTKSGQLGAANSAGTRGEANLLCGQPGEYRVGDKLLEKSKRRCDITTTKGEAYFFRGQLGKFKRRGNLAAGFRIPGGWACDGESMTMRIYMVSMPSEGTVGHKTQSAFRKASIAFEKLRHQGHSPNDRDAPRRSPATLRPPRAVGHRGR